MRALTKSSSALYSSCCPTILVSARGGRLSPTWQSRHVVAVQEVVPWPVSASPAGSNSGSPQGESMPPLPMMMPPMGSAGPASPPTANPGAMADSMSKVREAIHLLELALPGLAIGSEPHSAVVKALPGLSKAVPASEAVPGVQNTQLLALQQRAQQSAAMQAVMRAMGGGAGGPPGGPGAPPGPPGPMGGAMPPPGAQPPMM